MSKKMRFRVSSPPFSPGETNLFKGRYDFLFAHLIFEEGFIYGVVAQIDLMQNRGVRSKHDFRDWIERFAQKEIVPRISKLGNRNRLIVIGESARLQINLEILEVYEYEPLPETREWEFDQAIEFYYFPPIWVESSAVKPDRQVDFEAMKEEVFREELAHSGIRVAITRDGLFTIDFSNWDLGRISNTESADAFSENKETIELFQSLWVSVANIFLTCLHAVAAKKQFIHRPSVLTSSRIHVKASIDKGGGGSARAHLGLGEARNPLTYDNRLPPGMGDWRIVDREVLRPVKAETLKEALSTLDDVLRLPWESGIRRVELYGNASTAFCNGNLSSSLLQAWPVTESLLFEMWKNYLEGLGTNLKCGAKRLNRGRRNSLIGKGMAVAKVLNLMTVFEVLPHEICKSCDDARTVRNKLVHGLEQPAKDDVLKLLEVTEKLLNLVLGLDFKLPHYFSSQTGARPVT